VWLAGSRPPLRRDSLGGMMRSNAPPVSAHSLLAGARELAGALSVLVQHRADVPIRATALVAAHCVELALKAFLLSRGRSDASVTRLGHSLKKAWAEAAAAGLPVDAEPPPWCALLDSMHAYPYMVRYPPENSGLVAPNPLQMQVEVDRLIELVTAAPHAA
jgi:hypothetical protein